MLQMYCAANHKARATSWRPAFQPACTYNVLASTMTQQRLIRPDYRSRHLYWLVVKWLCWAQQCSSKAQPLWWERLWWAQPWWLLPEVLKLAVLWWWSAVPWSWWVPQCLRVALMRWLLAEVLELAVLRWWLAVLWSWWVPQCLWVAPMR